MNLKISDILSINGGLLSLADKPLTGKIAYPIYSNINKLESIIQVYNKTKDSLLKKYKVTNDDIAANKLPEELLKEHEELLCQSNAIDLMTINFKDLEDVKIPAITIKQLEKILVF